MDLFDATAHGFAHGMLDFGEGFLNRVKVRTIGRQEEQPCPGGADRSPDGLALVAAEVIDHDNIAWAEGLGELGFDISMESLGVDGAINHPRRFDAIVAQGRQECHGPPVAIRRVPDETGTAQPPAAQGRHVGLDPGFIDKNQPPAVNPALILSPLFSAARDLGPLLLGCHQRFFYNSAARASKTGPRWRGGP